MTAVTSFMESPMHWTSPIYWFSYKKKRLSNWWSAGTSKIRVSILNPWFKRDELEILPSMYVYKASRSKGMLHVKSLRLFEG